MSTSEEIPTIDSVRSFWQDNPCGNETSSSPDRLAYFREVEEYRYGHAPFIPRVAKFADYRGKRVLEIGCGMGTDGSQFAKGGADYVGVDLTEAAAQLARENLQARGLPGETLAANAEHLPFPDASFDHVYSFGVIHHTSNPSAVIDEIRRVLRPGGTVTVMLYNRTSINYYVEIMGLRRLGRAVLRPRFAPALIARLLGLSRDKLEGHRRQLLAIPRPTRLQWISMNTDGPDCPLARVYSTREAEELFGSFEGVRTDVHFFDRSHWPFLRRVISDRLVEAIGRRAGWNRMIYAVKPAA
jgi:2-polyprenyl-3-methyl-5-hydroxy-6-metoxy-1,4-benzoquinol methylase